MKGFTEGFRDLKTIKDQHKKTDFQRKLSKKIMIYFQGFFVWA